MTNPSLDSEIEQTIKVLLQGIQSSVQGSQGERARAFAEAARALHEIKTGAKGTSPFAKG